MGSFRILEHTADAGLEARGASLSDLFETAASAMFSIEYDVSAVGFELELDVSAEAEDLEGLLVAWLSELLYLHDTREFVSGDFIVVEIGEPPDRREGAPRFRVRGVTRGRRLGEWFEQRGPQIKAVTYHRLELGERRGGYEATVYVDV